MGRVSIEYNQLKYAGACSERYLFRQLFGSGRVNVTVTHAVICAHVFDWDWAAGALLFDHYRTQYWAEVALWEWSVHSTLKRQQWEIDAWFRLRAAAFAKAFLDQGGLERYWSNEDVLTVAAIREPIADPVPGMALAARLRAVRRSGGAAVVGD